MAKLYFRYGVMGASKSTQVIDIAVKYEMQDKKVLIFKPLLDERSPKNKISSRVAGDKECFDVLQNDDLYDITVKEQPFIVLVDEAHFLTIEQVKQLVRVVNELKIHVIAYGLKNSYVEGKIFDSVVTFLYYADSINEVKSICSFCDKKAVHNLRVVNGRAVYNGNTIQNGDVNNENSDFFIPTCNGHFKNNKYND